MSDVTVVIGAGQIGQAIARRVSAGKHVVLADLHQGNADAAAEVLANAGFEVSTATVDVSSRESVHALAETATALDVVTGVIHAAACHPAKRRPRQSSPWTCTEQHWSWKSSGTSSRRVGPVSSSHRSPATVLAP
jgi:NAD(P)-dependent dehydrogenase (short-subunit alcohol dehydrogenase family)